MSYNQPPPQPDPYGGAPGPYGQGGAAGQPGYGYPSQGPGQVPPQPGYGYPGQPGQPGQGQPGPYGQQPPPGPYGQPGQQPPYGQMPMPPQGGKNKTGIIVGAVVAVAAIGAGVFYALGSGSAEDDGPHKLTTPATVASEFKRQGPGRDDSSMSSGDKEELKQIPGVSDPHPVQAEYATASKKQMLLTGLWGKVESPEQVVDAMFVVLSKAASEKGGNVEPVGSPEDFEPEGLGSAVMKCQKFKITNDDPSAPVKTAELPVCIWGDSSTVGGVMTIDPLATIAGKADLNAASETAAKVRGDARVEIKQ
jgi:hypothetical protein